MNRLLGTLTKHPKTILGSNIVNIFRGPRMDSNLK